MNRGTLATLIKSALTAFLISLFYLLVLHPFSLLEIPKLKTQDLFFKLRYLSSTPPSVLKNITLVTIDDESIEKLRQRWPFQRRVYAEAIEKMTPFDPRLIGLDLIFSGKGDPVDDFLLARAVEKSGQVILASYVDPEGNLVTPLNEIGSSALGFGVVNKSLDRDLYVRRANLFYRDEKGNVLGWPWEVEALIRLLKFDRQNVQVNPKGVQFLAAGEPRYFIPAFDSRGIMINYRLKLKDVPQVPLWQLLETKDLRSHLDGKLVFVGATSRLFHDDYHTPLGLMSGVMVNINVLVSMLTRDFLTKVPLALDLGAIFFLVFLAAYLSLAFDVVRGLAALTLVTIGLLAGYYVLFLLGRVGDCFALLLSAWAVFLSISFHRYFRTFLENFELRGKVVTDSLTGLYNRRILESRINAELEDLASQKGARKMDVLYELSLLMIDVDNFKRINDEYGHQFGDDVLRNVSDTLKENTRKDDLACRFGGEEFCVVLPHTTKEQAGQIAEKIRVGVSAKEFNYVNKVAKFTVSVGVASAKEDSLFASRALIGAADSALYEAKRKGKNKVELYKKIK